VLKKLSATYVSIALLAEPIGSTLMGILLFNEIPSWIKVFGAFLILGGILLVSLNENKKQVQLTGS
jgi:drug/metabolite transporter (DMT)-like permease